MASITHIAESTTRTAEGDLISTDPSDIIIEVSEDEVLEAVKEIYEDEGLIPLTVTLIDSHTEEEIEIEVSDYLDLTTIALIEVKEIEL